MTKKILFRICVIEIYLRFDAWNLVLSYRYALCSMRYALLFIGYPAIVEHRIRRVFRSEFSLDLHTDIWFSI